jgi:stage V sporulation protein R
MSDYSMKELQEWNERIEEIVQKEGLNYYPQEFEIVSQDDMIGYEAYVGMPSHYPHWSYGKAYERAKTFNKYNLQGLPYEMVINSNPCLAYLMKDNTLLLQILTIAHVYGHNDFFKNNRLFRDGTRAEYTIEMFKNHANRVRKYIEDPSIGYKRVERILNAAHALRYQTSRVVGEKKLSYQEEMKRKMERYQKPEDSNPLLTWKRDKRDDMPIDIGKIPPSPEEDVLGFLTQFAHLNEWERDLLSIALEESRYFLPQIETKIMNEGWASFWHYTILNKLNLEQGLHIEFLKRHNQVIRPFAGQINPYYVGFKIFEDLKNRYGFEKIFQVREVERDQSFLMRYLTFDLSREMNLFEYEKKGSAYTVSEVSDDDGWKQVRNTLAMSVGMGGIPCIKVIELVKKDNTFVLEHEFDGRELELGYAYETLRHCQELWGGKVVLITVLDGIKKMITCEEDKKITMNGYN